MRLELTRRGDYAVRAMLALAEPRSEGGHDNGWLSVRRIAERMAIPHRFLPQVMRDLANAGLVEAQTGRSGGYRLARPAASISLLDVIEAVEGESRRQTCVLRGGPCGRDGYCAVHTVFFEAQEALLGHFERTSLAKVAAVLPRLGSPTSTASAAGGSGAVAEPGGDGVDPGGDGVDPSGDGPGPGAAAALSRRPTRPSPPTRPTRPGPPTRPSRTPSARRTRSR
jgi:Rrf2 family protein